LLRRWPHFVLWGVIVEGSGQRRSNRPAAVFGAQGEQRFDRSARYLRKAVRPSRLHSARTIGADR
jgi:hypothetical protein